jgi:hypothetical protein
MRPAALLCINVAGNSMKSHALNPMIYHAFHYHIIGATKFPIFRGNLIATPLLRMDRLNTSHLAVQCA